MKKEKKEKGDTKNYIIDYNIIYIFNFMDIITHIPYVQVPVSGVNRRGGRCNLTGYRGSSGGALTIGLGGSATGNGAAVPGTICGANSVKL